MPNTTGSRVSQVRANDPGTIILDYGPTRNGKTTRYRGGTTPVHLARVGSTSDFDRVNMPRRYSTTKCNANDFGVFKFILRANSIGA